MTAASIISFRKANALRQAAFVERQKAKGLRLVRYAWAYPEDHAAIKAHAKRLTKKREKAAA